MSLLKLTKADMFVFASYTEGNSDAVFEAILFYHYCAYAAR
jgi:hypothetical protein